MHIATRRQFNLLAAGTLVAGAVPSSLVAATDVDPIGTAITDIEAKLRCRLGVAICTTGTPKIWQRRAQERFAFTSTFKAFASAALLAKVDRGEDRLDRRVVFQARDLVTYSPVTEKHVGGAGLTLAEIATAAIQLSDNTAGNLLLDAIGGSEGLTAFFRASGDETSRLDRREPDLNTAIPGDLRDTTTPAAAARLLERLFFGSLLSEASRRQLAGWMEGDQVAGPLLRAGLPKTWTIADKTGAGGNGARAIVAIATPPTGPALSIAIYLAETSASMDDRNAAIARIGSAIAEGYGR